ncbi:MAG: RodZ domain-containing protein [Candidatus Sulfotelmatobacter sp.]
MGELGEKFRKAREAKELSFDDVSNVIKISPRMLKAIEEAHYDQLPGGVFNKGFIRAYAKHLGLDPEEAVNEYLAFVREEQLKAQQAWQAERPVETRSSAGKSAGSTRSKSAESPVGVEELPGLQLPRAKDVRSAHKKFLPRSTSDFPWRLVAAAVVAAALGIFLWIRHTRAPQTLAAKSNPPVLSAPAPVPASASGPVVAAQSSASNSRPLHPAAAITATSPARTASTLAPVQSNEQSTDVTVHNIGKPLAKSTDQPASTLNLVVRATEDSWIYVRADGQTVAEETLIAPADSTFHASREIVIKVGNAAGINFVLGGKQIPPQGAEGEVKTIVFDAQGMRILPPTPSPTQNQTPDQSQTPNQ